MLEDTEMKHGVEVRKALHDTVVQCWVSIITMHMTGIQKAFDDNLASQQENVQNMQDVGKKMPFCIYLLFIYKCKLRFNQRCTF